MGDLYSVLGVTLLSLFHTYTFKRIPVRTLCETPKVISNAKI